MANFDYEYKLLHLEIKENEDKYISGELPLDEPLQKTEELYDNACRMLNDKDKKTSTKFSHDSTLMQLQSKIVRQRVKSYKPDSVVFEPRDFSERLKRHFMGFEETDGRSQKLTKQQYSIMWQKLGEESQKKMHVTPTFDFLYGTFSAEPASPVKKKRRRIEKDKVANAVKPKTVDMSKCSEKKDIMLKRAEHIYRQLSELLKKNGKDCICFYEFVINPHSFSLTIENIFSVTLLLQNGFFCIFPDEEGLPFIRIVPDDERKERAREHKQNKQSVLSMGLEEWKTLIEKGNFKEPKIKC